MADAVVAHNRCPWSSARRALCVSRGYGSRPAVEAVDGFACPWAHGHAAASFGHGGRESSPMADRAFDCRNIARFTERSGPNCYGVQKVVGTR
eukprot:6850184-Prymnesium_polylepis.1